jgi:hypothetical protein
MLNQNEIVFPKARAKVYFSLNKPLQKVAFKNTLTETS